MPRSAPIAGILISGDTAPERLRDAKDKGYVLLHKPVDPMQLRAVMHQLLRDGDAGKGSKQAAQTFVSAQSRISEGM